MMGMMGAPAPLARGVIRSVLLLLALIAVACFADSARTETVKAAAEVTD